jgi:hypothetical protein
MKSPARCAADLSFRGQMLRFTQHDKKVTVPTRDAST